MQIQTTKKAPRKQPLPTQHIARIGTGGIGQARALCDRRTVVQIREGAFRLCPKCESALTRMRG